MIKHGVIIRTKNQEKEKKEDRFLNQRGFNMEIKKSVSTAAKFIFDAQNISSMN